MSLQNVVCLETGISSIHPQRSYREWEYIYTFYVGLTHTFRSAPLLR